MTALRVAVLGAAGRMGRTVVDAVNDAADLELVASLTQDDDITTLATTGAQVAVDFTSPAATEANVHALITQGIHAVVGTSGWTPEALNRVQATLGARPDTGVVIAPSFALGAVLAMHFAEQAAAWFESAEVVELHHPGKLDAPSGTAIHTAEAIARGRSAGDVGPMPDATESALDGARGAQVAGVPVHSVRLRGLTAHEEILFGNPGEQLTIRHDSFDRLSFMPGVLHAIRAISGRPGLTVGLDQLLNLGR